MAIGVFSLQVETFALIIALGVWWGILYVLPWLAEWFSTSPVRLSRLTVRWTFFPSIACALLSILIAATIGELRMIVAIAIAQTLWVLVAVVVRPIPQAT